MIARFRAALAALVLIVVPAGAEVTLPTITVAPVTQARIVDRVLATGLVEPAERVDVAPQIEGQAVDALYAEAGDRVAEGAVLARLSGDALALQKSQLVASRASAEAAVAQAEASVTDARATAAEAERVAERTANLRARGTATQAALDQATAAATSARARLTAAEQGLAVARAQLAVIDAQIGDVELRLRRTQIAAPVAGIVLERNARQGAIASAAGAPMFVLARDGAMELHADVAEADLARIAPGQAVTVRAAGLADPLAAEVRLVEPMVDRATRLGRVRIALPAAAGLRPGLFAGAEIVVSEEDALAVPVTAVARGSVLRVDAAGVVERVAVETGVRDGGLVAIRGGLAAGDRIVARAGAFVRPGDRVRPVTAAPVSN